MIKNSNRLFGNFHKIWDYGNIKVILRKFLKHILYKL